MISSRNFAQTALNVYNNHTVPYKSGGKSLIGMDSAGFIEYCLRQHGVQTSYKGTNDLYRNGGIMRMSLKDALSKNLVVPGVLLLHVVQDGKERSEYKRDGLGNCDFASIAISATEAVYPSKIRERLIKTKIELVDGKANMLMYSKFVDYGQSLAASAPSQQTSNPSTSQLLAPGKIAYTTSNLKLREGPSTDFKSIKTIPKNTQVNLLGQENNWFQVSYSVGTSRHEGWCCGDYLRP